MSANRFSQLISYLLHPLLIPSIAVGLLLFGNSVMGNIGLSLKLFFLATLVLDTVVIPALSIGLLYKFRIIPDLQLKEQRSRTLPIVIMGICYLVCLFLLWKVLLAFLIQRILLAAVGCAILALVVTRYWKISLHMIGVGGLLAMLTILNFSGFVEGPYTLLLFILLSGALGSARLQLGAHNIAQVAAGFAGGFLISTLAMFWG